MSGALRLVVSTSLPSLFCAWLGLGSLSLALAQERSQGPKPSAGGSAIKLDQEMSPVRDPQSDSEVERQGPPRAPRFLPPVLRPNLTPEELEEAERLRRLAAVYGTDPTAIVGRVQLSSQYQSLPHGAQYTTTVVRTDIPYRGNWLLRVDAPVHTWLDPNHPRLSSEQGVGDLTAILGWRAYNTPEYAFLIGVITTYPTASDTLLGTGKYTVGPIMATGRFLSRWESFLFGVFTHQVSVGGDPSRQDQSRSQATLQINTIWSRWWTTLQGVWQVDWEHKAKTSMTLEFELGRNLVGGWGAYVRPGVGVWGPNVPGAYDWNIEVGTRYMFKSF